MPYDTSHSEEIKPQWRARLEDSLSASTRAKRRLLLIVGTVALVAVILGIFPTKIEALGIAIETKDQRNLLILLALVNCYAIVGFILYSWADIHLQARIQNNANGGYVSEFVKGRASSLESLNYVIRFAFDFLVPIAYGGYALWRLYFIIFTIRVAA